MLSLHFVNILHSYTSLFFFSTQGQQHYLYVRKITTFIKIFEFKMQLNSRVNFLREYYIQIPWNHSSPLLLLCNEISSSSLDTIENFLLGQHCKIEVYRNNNMAMHGTGGFCDSWCLHWTFLSSYSVSQIGKKIPLQIVSW